MNLHCPLLGVVGQFGTGQLGTQTIWHRNSKIQQFGTKKADGQFVTKIRKQTSWLQLSENEQFCTWKIWHKHYKKDNLALQFV